MTNLILAGWALSVGFIPLSSLEAGGATPYYDMTFVQTAEAGFTIAEMFRVFTTIEIRETKADSFYFDPYRGDFRIGAEFLYKDLVVGIAHECNHDIVTGAVLNRYNGWDAAFLNVYGGWFWKFPVRQDITLKPSVFLGVRPYDNLYLKYNTHRQYFGSSVFKEGHSNRVLYVRGGIDGDMFGFLNFHCSLQPDLSLDYGLFSRFEINIGLEFHYYNIAGGLEWINQMRLYNPDYAVRELKLYIAFRGKSSLLEKD